jgi:hypothetical protein
MAEETWAEEVARLRREIAVRQSRLQYLILGDQTKGVSLSCNTAMFLYNDHMR